MEQLEFMISPEESNTRIDKYLSEQLEGTSRSYIQKLIENGQVSVNGKAVKSNYKLRADDVLSVEIPEPEELKVEAEEIPLSVLYEDEQLLVVDKPKG